MSSTAAAALLGTWRLRSYVVWDVDNKPSYPRGENPVGFAVFTPGGSALIQLARRIEPSELDSEPKKADAAESYVAYFGKLEHHQDKGEFTVVVEGSNQAEYIGTRQVRRYEVSGNELRLGIHGQYQAVLEREHSGEPISAA